MYWKPPQSLSDVDPRNQREFVMLEQAGTSVAKITAERPNLYMGKEEMVRLVFLPTTAEQIQRRFEFGDNILTKLSELDPANMFYVTNGIVNKILYHSIEDLPQIHHWHGKENIKHQRKKSWQVFGSCSDYSKIQ